MAFPARIKKFEGVPTMDEIPHVILGIGLRREENLGCVDPVETSPGILLLGELCTSSDSKAIIWLTLSSWPTAKPSRRPGVPDA
jgi:hypothetical protein